MKPLIAITVDTYHDENEEIVGPQHKIRTNYCELIAEAGGVPLVIPASADMEVVAKIISGWLIPGGYDMDAAIFGQENHEKSVLQDPKRYDAESRLFKAVDAELPILGICYGCQFLNVAHGGDLIQHVPDVVGNASHEGGTPQSYEVDPDSRLFEVLGASEVTGLSYHHQAIGRPGKGLSVVAKHEDGTVEAIEGTGSRWLYGVQWHPERTRSNEATIKLFQSFVEAATRYNEGRGR